MVTKSRYSMHSVKHVLAMVFAAVFAVALSGCAGVGTKTGRYVDDATITTKVKTAFATDKAVSAMDIHVDTHNGNVRLSGMANSPTEKQRAEEIARGVSGVKSVINDINVQTASSQGSSRSY